MPHARAETERRGARGAARVYVCRSQQRDCGRWCWCTINERGDPQQRCEESVSGWSSNERVMCCAQWSFPYQYMQVIAILAV